MLAWCFVWLKARFLLDQVALGRLGSWSGPSSLPPPAQGGGRGLAQPRDAFPFWSSAQGSQWLKQEAVGHWAPFQLYGLSEPPPMLPFWGSLVGRDWGSWARINPGMEQ